MTFNIQENIEQTSYKYAEEAKPQPHSCIVSKRDLIEFKKEVMSRMRHDQPHIGGGHDVLSMMTAFGQVFIYPGPPEMQEGDIWYCEEGETVEERKVRGYNSLMDQKMNDIVMDIIYDTDTQKI